MARGPLGCAAAPRAVSAAADHRARPATAPVDPLPLEGPTEVRDLTSRFNAMTVAELETRRAARGRAARQPAPRPADADHGHHRVRGPRSTDGTATGDDAGRAARAIEEEAGRLERLVGQLGAWSGSHRAMAGLRPERITIAGLLAQTASGSGRAWPRPRGVEIVDESATGAADLRLRPPTGSRSTGCSATSSAMRSRPWPTSRAGRRRLGRARPRLAVRAGVRRRRPGMRCSRGHRRRPGLPAGSDRARLRAVLPGRSARRGAGGGLVWAVHRPRSRACPRRARRSRRTSRPTARGSASCYLAFPRFRPEERAGPQPVVGCPPTRTITVAVGRTARRRTTSASLGLRDPATR